MRRPRRRKIDTAASFGAGATSVRYFGGNDLSAPPRTAEQSAADLAGMVAHLKASVPGVRIFVGKVELEPRP